MRRDGGDSETNTFQAAGREPAEGLKGGVCTATGGYMCARTREVGRTMLAHDPLRLSL